MKAKARGRRSDFKTFTKNGHTFLILRTGNGEYQIFKEVDAKNVAREFGETEEHTRAMWKTLWKDLDGAGRDGSEDHPDLAEMD